MLTITEAVIIRINNLCKEKKMTLLELAERSGVRQSTINEIMQGRSKHPRVNTLNKIAQGFGMSLSEFFDDEVFQQIVDEDPTPKRKREFKMKDYVPHYNKKQNKNHNSNNVNGDDKSEK